MTDISEKTKQQPSTLYQVFDMVRFIVVCLVIVIPLRAFVAQPFIVRGASMDPTFADKNYLIVDQIEYRLHEPQRGDVVVFRFPSEPSRFLIKRIIGLPGETVVLNGTEVIIKNEEHPEGITLEEDYISQPLSTNQETSLSETEYFVMGDNRPNSFDSRGWGPLDQEYIVGRPWVRLLPMSTIDLHPGDHRGQYVDSAE